MKLVMRVQTSTLVGGQLCRDEEFAALFSGWLVSFLPSALLIRCFPRILRRPAGLAVRQLLRWRFFRPMEEKLMPFASAAVEHLATTGSHPPLELEDSALYCLAKELAKSTQPGANKMLEPRMLADIMINFSFAGSNTAFQLKNVLIEVLCYKDSVELMAELRKEIRTVTDSLEDAGRFSWSDMERMVLLDSVIRETLRLHPPNLVAHERLAMEDVVTPDGIVLATGTKVSVSSSLSNQDESVYPDSSNFDPYRFMDKEKMYTINSDFVSFGTGKRTCPGRWTATALMKMVLARLLTEFDFEPIDERPEPWYIGLASIPSPLFTVNMRKRKVDSKGKDVAE